MASLARAIYFTDGGVMVLAAAVAVFAVSLVS